MLYIFLKNILLKYKSSKFKDIIKIFQQDLYNFLKYLVFYILDKRNKNVRQYLIK